MTMSVRQVALRGTSVYALRNPPHDGVLVGFELMPGSSLALLPQVRQLQHIMPLPRCLWFSSGVYCQRSCECQWAGWQGTGQRTICGTNKLLLFSEGAYATSASSEVLAVCRRR